eukprot:COSAG02_NODE_1302_length_13358_cov_12.308243_3_plen_82_part_00
MDMTIIPLFFSLFNPQSAPRVYTRAGRRPRASIHRSRAPNSTPFMPSDRLRPWIQAVHQRARVEGGGEKRGYVRHGAQAMV